GDIVEPQPCQDSSLLIMESEPCSEDSVETASDESPPQFNPSSRVKLNHPLEQ
ncbi:hypothetical protein U1Q18_034720, partial [Sarracenia purpurea var. burkii]